MKIGRKASGGRYIQSRKKKHYEMPGQERIVKLGDHKKKTKRMRGGHQKSYLLKAKSVNVKTKKEIKMVEIKKVLETPSNRFLARQNVLTKGTIIETELGKVRITNRPSQEGIVNGVLVE